MALHSIHACVHCGSDHTPLLQGYGLTETCGASCIANPYDAAQASTIGAPVAGLLLRLESVPDMEYDACAARPQGELLLKGPAVFSAYHKRADLTDEAKGALKSALLQPALRLRALLVVCCLELGREEQNRAHIETRFS
jgi:acyl-CoA synthetase (AMP-forming)/AMP-acid ligase II